MFVIVVYGPVKAGRVLPDPPDGLTMITVPVGSLPEGGRMIVVGFDLGLLLVMVV